MNKISNEKKNEIKKEKIKEFNLWNVKKKIINRKDITINK